MATKNKTIRFRCTPAGKVALEQLAKDYEISVSKLVWFAIIARHQTELSTIYANYKRELQYVNESRGAAGYDEQAVAALVSKELDNGGL